MEKKITLKFKTIHLSKSIKKANQLVELLREAQQIIDSLSSKNGL